MPTLYIEAGDGNAEHTLYIEAGGMEILCPLSYRGWGIGNAELTLYIEAGGGNTVPTLI